MNWPNRFLFGGNLVLAAILVYFLIFRSVVAPTDAWSRADLVTISLASVTVELTGLAIFLGVLAVWGYTTLREHATRDASEKAVAMAREEMGAVATRAVQAAMAQFATPQATADLPDSLSKGE